MTLLQEESRWAAAYVMNLSDDRQSDDNLVASLRHSETGWGQEVDDQPDPAVVDYLKLLEGELETCREEELEDHVS